MKSVPGPAVWRTIPAIGWTVGLALAGAAALSGCDGGTAAQEGESQTVVIRALELRQRISGFGASSAWTAPMLSDELADQFFSVERGIGLSLLRLRIAPDGTTGETATAHQALERGAKVWAAPWSPPAEWKLPPAESASNESAWREANAGGLWGGQLDAKYYGAWAERLVGFVSALSAEGVPLLALSAQNEPDYVAGWETCRWTPDELKSFIGEHLAPRLAQAALPTRIMAPEVSGWGSVSRYTDPLLADEAARSSVGIIATHGYNGVPFDYQALESQGKELWVTEASMSGSGSPGMTSALALASKMNDDLSIGEVNAWHYWWLMPRTDSGATADTGSALVVDGQLTRRAYVMGQFSRFLRPGSVRLAISTDKPSSGVAVSAYQSAEGAELVVVVSNLSGEAPVDFELADRSVSELVPWVTSETQALEPRTPIAGGAAFEYLAPARSVTTLVGRFE